MSSKATAAGDRLAAWARASGATVSPKVAYLQTRGASDAGDRRCVATSAIEEDEVLLEVWPLHGTFNRGPNRL